MANNANNKGDDKQAAPVTIENATVSEVKPAKPILLWIAILILLLLGAGLYWLIEQQKLAMADLTEQLASTESSVDSRLSQLRQKMTSEAAATSTLLDNLNQSDVGLADKITEIAKVQDMTNDDVKRVWTMAEVEYLLQTANQRVQLASDNDAAISALRLADERLEELADPRFYRLRALLADELLALSSVAKIDIDGMAVKLQSLIEQVDKLQVLMAPEVTEDQIEQAVDDAAGSIDWQGALQSAWDEVRSLVVIRRQEDGAAAVLVPEERYFLYQNLRLKLETARLALLDQRERVYHDSLSSAQQWLEQYFIGDERDAALSAIQALNAEKITVEMPDVSGSLVWLQEKKGEL